MNFEEKQKIHIRLRDALEAEKISQRIAEECLAINQGYISMVKVGTNLKAVQEKVWDKLKAWSDSRMPITAFKGGVLIHKGNVEPERVPLKVEITTVGDFIDHAQKDLDQAQIKHNLDEEQKKWEEPNIPTFEEIEKEMADAKAENDIHPILVNEDRDDLRSALRTIGSVIRSADGTEFYFLPLWFKMNGDQPIEIMGLDKLPWEVRMILKTMNPV